MSRYKSKRSFDAYLAAHAQVDAERDEKRKLERAGDVLLRSAGITPPWMHTITITGDDIIADGAAGHRAFERYFGQHKNDSNAHAHTRGAHNPQSRGGNP